jgi:hypothetical protein
MRGGKENIGREKLKAASAYIKCYDYLKKIRNMKEEIETLNEEIEELKNKNMYLDEVVTNAVAGLTKHVKLYNEAIETTKKLKTMMVSTMVGMAMEHVRKQ